MFNKRYRDGGAQFLIHISLVLLYFEYLLRLTRFLKVSLLRIDLNNARVTKRDLGQITT